MLNNKKFSFSIVIPCRNERDYISKCIDSIINQDYDQALIEIIIVDGFSDDGTRDIINEMKSQYSNIKSFDNPQQKTPHALNIGIKKSNNDIIVILGAHTEINKDFISLNNKFQVEKNVKVTGGTQNNVGESFIQKAIGMVMEIPFGMGNAKYRWSNKEQYVDTVVYAAYRRELFDELGLFEENFSISEDAEFNWRIRQAGYKIFYSPKIKSKYYPRKSLLSFIKQIFRYGILRVNVIKKHVNAIKLYHLIPPVFLVSLILLFVFTLFNIVNSNLIIYFLLIYFLLSFLMVFNKIRLKGIQYLLILPILIFIVHISWGLGFIIGFILPKSDKL